MVEYLTFSRCISDFLIDRASGGKSQKTLTFYTLELKYFFQWLDKNGLAKQEITALTSSQIRQYYIELATHRNQGGCHASYRAVKAFLNWCELEYELEWKNPIRKVKIEPNRIPPLPEIPMENIQKLLEACETTKDKKRNIAILKVLADTGLRGSELLSLNVGSLDLEIGKITLLHGKGNKSRIVWLGEKAKKAMKEYLDQREIVSENDPLFMNDSKERLKFHGLTQLLIRLSAKADVPFQGVHSFRRYFALTLWKKKVDLLSISRYLGHSSLAVTTRYLNVGNNDLMEIHNQNSPADILN